MKMFPNIANFKTIANLYFINYLPYFYNKQPQYFFCPTSFSLCIMVLWNFTKMIVERQPAFLDSLPAAFLLINRFTARPQRPPPH